MAWLLCQVTSLAAFLPPSCCAAHEVHAMAAEECHEGTPAEACPMRGGDGAACPMHQQATPADPHAAHHAQSEEPHAGHHAAAGGAASPSDDCRLSAACEGPALALSMLISVPAILPAETLALTLPPAPQADTFAGRLLTPPASHDTPPPKA